jgi:hypothetical protein
VTWCWFEGDKEEDGQEQPYPDGMMSAPAFVEEWMRENSAADYGYADSVFVFTRDQSGVVVRWEVEMNWEPSCYASEAPLETDDA